MNITRLAQAANDTVYGWIIVDEKGKRIFMLEDNQGLGKKCTQIVDKSMHGGVIGHMHNDFTAGTDKREKAPVRDVVIDQ